MGAGRLDMRDLIGKLRRASSTAAIFGDRVAGVAHINRIVEYANMAAPSAYVVYIGELAEAAEVVNENVQWVTETWGVAVKLAAHEEIRGQAPAMTVPEVRRAILRAIFNWSPSLGYSLFAYRGCEPVIFQAGGNVSRDVTVWLFTFTTRTQIDECDGETEEQFDPLPEFLGVNANVDAIDPYDPGLPPSQPYKPELVPPHSTGPEGRIETSFTIDITTGPPP
jgi:hypothetical protein